MEWTKVICVTLVLIACGEDSNGDEHEGELQPKPEKWDIVVPKKMDDCPLRYDTIFPGVVKIWDSKNKKSAGHGNIITYKSILSTCAVYSAPDFHVSNYKIIAQNVWNLTDPVHLCSQTTKPVNYLKHPKCNGIDSTFFNFGVWVLPRPFKIQGSVYPFFIIPSTPYDLLRGVRFINAEPVGNSCIVPLFKPQNEQPEFSPMQLIVERIPWFKKCIPLLCEKNPADQGFTQMCTKRFKDRAVGMHLCVYPKYSDTIPPVEPDPSVNYWYAGAPLTCNATVYGITSEVKHRSTFPTEKQDFHLVVTILRAWQWLREMKALFARKPKFAIVHEEPPHEEPITDKPPPDGKEPIWQYLPSAVNSRPTSRWIFAKVQQQRDADSFASSFFVSRHLLVIVFVISSALKFTFS